MNNIKDKKMGLSYACIIAVMVVIAAHDCLSLRAINKLPCRTNKIAKRSSTSWEDPRSGRTFDYLLDFLSGEMPSLSSNDLPCSDYILSEESTGDGELEQNLSEEYDNGGAADGYPSKPISPPYRPMAPLKPLEHESFLNFFEFHGHKPLYHTPPPPVHRPLPPGHYPMRPPLLVPGKPPSYPVRPTRPPRPPKPDRPLSEDGLLDIFGSVFGGTRPPFSTMIEDVKPVNEEATEGDPYVSWKPVGLVGVPSYMVVGQNQDISNWSTVRPDTDQRIYTKRKRNPKQSPGIFGSFVDLLLRRR